MATRLRRLCLTLTAVLVVAGTATGSASAEDFFFLSEAETTTLTGVEDSTHVFTTTAGTVQCSDATFTGTIVDTELNTVELTPAYSGCSAGSPTTATFEANGCTYRINNATIEAEPYEGTVDIVCPGSEEITMKVEALGSTVCTIDIPAQTGLGTATYTTLNQNEESEVTVSVNISNTVQYSHTGGLCSSGSSATGSFSGSAVLTGEEGESAAGFAVGRNLTVDVYSTPFQLNFKGMGKGKTTTITISNSGGLKVYLGKHTIEPNEEDFSRSGGTCPVGALAGGGSCTVIIEAQNEKKIMLQQYVLKYGTYWNDERHTLKVDLIRP